MGSIMTQSSMYLALTLVLAGACAADSDSDDDGTGSAGSGDDGGTDGGDGTGGDDGTGDDGGGTGTGSSAGTATGSSSSTGTGSSAGTGTGSSSSTGTGSSSGTGTGSGGEVQCSTEPIVFPEFDKSCGNEADCALVFHTINCCGTDVAWGINADEVPAFEAAEAICDSQYPGCGCPAQATEAEDGNTSWDPNDFAVQCDGGTCMSYVP